MTGELFVWHQSHYVSVDSEPATENSEWQSDQEPEKVITDYTKHLRNFLDSSIFIIIISSFIWTGRHNASHY